MATGGTCFVYKWKPRKSESCMAVKVIKLSTAKSRICYDREVEILHSMWDVGRVVKITRHWVSNINDLQVGHLALEFCKGGDLHTYVKRQGRLAEFSVSLIIQRLIKTLRAIHKRGIAHRDIKLENIFLRTNDPTDVILGDFGLAIDTTRELPFSRSGTLDYMSPEVKWLRC